MDNDESIFDLIPPKIIHEKRLQCICQSNPYCLPTATTFGMSRTGMSKTGNLNGDEYVEQNIIIYEKEKHLVLKLSSSKI